MIGRRDHGQVVHVRRRHVDGDAGGVEGVVGPSAILVHRAAVGSSDQVAAWITQPVVDGDPDTLVSTVGIGAHGLSRDRIQGSLHIGQLALEDKGLVISIGIVDACSSGVIQLTVGICATSSVQKLHRDLNEVQLTRLRTIGQVDVAQGNAGQRLARDRRIQHQQARMAGSDGGLVVGALQHDAEFRRRDSGALGRGAGLVGRVVAIADHVLELVVELFAAAVLVLHRTAVELRLGEDRTDTEHAATSSESPVLRHCSDAVLALLAGVVTVLVHEVRNRVGWCRSRATAGAISAGGIAGSASNGERGALFQGRHAAIAWLGNAHEGGCIVERIDADVDDDRRAGALLVGGVARRRVRVGVGVVRSARHALVIERHDGKAVGVVLATVVAVCE